MPTLEHRYEETLALIELFKCEIKIAKQQKSDKQYQRALQVMLQSAQLENELVVAAIFKGHSF